MGLLIVGASVIAVATLLLIAILMITEDLFSESVFGVPELPGEVTQSYGMHEEHIEHGSSARW